MGSKKKSKPLPKPPPVAPPASIIEETDVMGQEQYLEAQQEARMGVESTINPTAMSKAKKKKKPEDETMLGGY